MNKNNNYNLFLTEVNDFFDKKEFIKAERKISEFIEQNPKNHLGFYLLGSNYLLMDRLKLAEIYFNKCNEIIKFAPAYKSLGVIYFKLAKKYKNPNMNANLMKLLFNIKRLSRSIQNMLGLI